MTTLSQLKIIVRAHTTRSEGPKDQKLKRAKPNSSNPYPRLALVLHCVTTTDSSQRLKVGVYCLYDSNELLEEGVFHADDLPPHEIDLLLRYWRSHREGDAVDGEPLCVNTQEQFLKDVFKGWVVKGRAVIVGFNLPFEISRLAKGWSLSRSGATKDGFSLIMRTYQDSKGSVKQDAFFPRIAIKSIDGKRALIQYTSSWRKRSKGWRGGDWELGSRGVFVDCRTLTFALTGEEHTLESACKRFGIDHSGSSASTCEKLTDADLDQARRDIHATWELYLRLLEEFKRHPIDLTPNRVFSPATIGKAYLKAMEIHLPWLQAESGLRLSDDEVQGFAMAAYYGGNAECHIRRVAVPVVYLDFMSMYPTISSLTGLWDLLTAEGIEAFDASEEVKRLLARVTAKDLFDPAAWKETLALVQVLPQGDLLPVRAYYSQSRTAPYSTGLNFVSSKSPIWYTLADCIASKLHTGRSPAVVRAIGFRPVGKQSTLHPVDFRGSIRVDPASDDFFRKLVEARCAIGQDKNLDRQERERLEHALKTIANSTTYGIFIELNRQENPETKVNVFGTVALSGVTDHPEEPGPFYYPILGSLLTGGARLMLTLAELEVLNSGGTYAFMDTDSIAIVANEEGGLIPCPGGTASGPGKRAAIKALSWALVEEIRARFAALNPYNPEVIPGSILRLEDENFVPCPDGSSALQQLWCFSISSKRYALYNLKGGEPVMRKCSKHGLGYYLSPVDAKTGEPVGDWIDLAWDRIVRESMGLKTGTLPSWGKQLALTQVSVSTPSMMTWFQAFNLRDPSKPGGPVKLYGEAVKPFNSLQHVPLDRLRGRPPGISHEEPFCLVRPIGDAKSGPARWVNLHDPAGGFYDVVAGRTLSVGPRICVGRTYSDLILEHGLQPEAKSVGPDGKPCTPRTVGLLGPRHIEVEGIVHIGKEANELELVQAGLVGDEEEVLNTYETDHWDEIWPLVARMPARAIQEALGCSRREAYYLKAGKRRLSRKQLPKLARSVG